jgi:TRAP-type uncharacterized transport system substrate-binding protein
VAVITSLLRFKHVKGITMLFGRTNLTHPSTRAVSSRPGAGNSAEKSLQEPPLSAACGASREWMERPTLVTKSGGLMYAARIAPLLFLLAHTALAWSQQCPPGATILLTGSKTGYYHLLGTAIQQIAASKGIHICAQETDQTLTNISRLDEDGAIAFALVQSDVAHDAWFGHRPTFTKKLRNVTLVTPLYVEALHILVRPHLNIASLADLRGKKVWLGRSGSATEFTARRVLAAAGLAIDGSSLDRVESVVNSWSFCAAVERLRNTDGRLDAVFRVTIVPAADIQDTLEQTHSPEEHENYKRQEHPEKNEDKQERACVGPSEIRLLPLDFGLVDRMTEDGSYIADLIPSAAYGLNRSTLTVGVQAWLATNRPSNDPVVQTLAHLIRTERFAIQKVMAQSLGNNHHHQHENITPSLSLINVTLPKHVRDHYVHPLAQAELFDSWRDSWRPLLPFLLLPLLAAFLFFLRLRIILRHLLLRQPQLTFALVSTALIWLVGAGLLYHLESTVNEYYNSFPRSLGSTFLYFASFPGQDLVTQAGRSAGQIVKWINLVALGGFAIPLMKQALDKAFDLLVKWLKDEHATPAKVPSLKSVDVSTRTGSQRRLASIRSLAYMVVHESLRPFSRSTSK